MQQLKVREQRSEVTKEVDKIKECTSKGMKIEGEEEEYNKVKEEEKQQPNPVGDNYRNILNKQHDDKITSR